jgi:hypothetical protein
VSRAARFAEARWHGRDLAHALRGAKDVSEATARAQAGRDLGAVYASLCRRLGWSAQEGAEAWPVYEAAFLDRMTGRE